MANRAVALAVMMFLAYGVCEAGPLYGTVRLRAASPEPVRVFVACPSFAHPNQEELDVGLDARGSFAMRVRTIGRCEMQLRAGPRAGTPFAVFVSNNPLRYDFGVDEQLNRVP